MRAVALTGSLLALASTLVVVLVPFSQGCGNWSTSVVGTAPMSCAETAGVTGPASPVIVLMAVAASAFALRSTASPRTVAGVGAAWLVVFGAACMTVVLMQPQMAPRVDYFVLGTTVHSNAIVSLFLTLPAGAVWLVGTLVVTAKPRHTGGWWG